MSHRHQSNQLPARPDQISAKDLENLKERVQKLNYSMGETRLNLTNFIMEANCKAQVATSLQKEMECKEKLEALAKLIRDGKEN